MQINRYEITNPWIDGYHSPIDREYIKQRKKHEETCAKNRRNRKKRK